MDTPQAVLQRLKDGNARFVADMADGQLQDSKRRRQLVAGQSPYAVILSCADSRVVPELAFDTGLGELFVIRVAGNVANTSTVASIEYAVEHLESGVCVVLGHDSCGAVTAAIDGASHGDNLDHLLSHIHPARDQPGSSDVNAVVKRHAQHTAKHLAERSSVINGALEAGKLTIVAAYYDLNEGSVTFLDAV